MLHSCIHPSKRYYYYYHRQSVRLLTNNYISRFCFLTNSKSKTTILKETNLYNSYNLMVYFIKRVIDAKPEDLYLPALEYPPTSPYKEPSSMKLHD